METGRLLIVDDDEHERDELVTHLVNAGYESLAVSNRESLDRIGTQEFDLVMLVVRTPEANGMKVLEDIRSCRSIMELPVIVSCIRDDADIVVQSFRLGANDCMTTSLDCRIALARIGSQLAQLRMARLLVKETEELARKRETSALGRVLAQFSHEVNNPINVIKNNIPPMREYLQAIQTMMSAYIEAEARLGGRAFDLHRMRNELEIDFVLGDFGSALAVIELATRRVQAVQTDLRLFIRGEAPKFMPADLNAELSQTVELFKRTLPSGIKIRVECGELPQVVCHVGELNQVFLNLIQNSLDALGNSGEVLVKTELEQERIRLEFYDTGPGIPLDIQSRVFEPFFTTKDVGKGTGLGLAVCHRIIVENHAGTIELDTKIATGTRFVVYLPLDPSLEKEQRTRVAGREQLIAL